MSKYQFPAEVPEDHAAKLSDPDRLAALERSALMDSLPEEAYDRAVRLATTAIGAEVGLLSLVDTERQFFKAQIGLNGDAAVSRQTPLSQSFCQYVVTTDRPLAVSNAAAHSLLCRNGAVSDLGVCAYLGVPVHAPDGQPIGSFCAIEGSSRDWTDEDIAILQDLAAVIESEIRLRQELVARQLLVSELNHRVKNLFSVVSGMIGMTAQGSENPAAMARTLRGRIGALARAHDLIRPATTLEPDTRADVSLQALLVTLLEPHLTHHDDHVTVDGQTLTLGPSAATNMALVLHEFATNAAKYGALSVAEGKLCVTWTNDNGRLALTWDESNVPERTASPSKSGFGTRLVDMTVRGHFRGTIDTEWRADGLCHHLSMPIGRTET